MTSDDDELLLEMKALAVRYGVDKCQNALDAVKQSSAPTVVTKKFTKSIFLNPATPTISAYACLLSWALFPTTKFKITFFLRALQESIEPILTLMEEYYDSIVQQQQPLDPSYNIRQVESPFRTLYLEIGSELTLQILERTKWIALFEKVIIRQSSIDAPISRDVFDRIVDLVVNEGVISSLGVHGCVLEYDQTTQLAQLLETNQLEALELPYFSPDERYRAHFGQALTRSLCNHIEMFPDVSRLKVLELHDACTGMDSIQQLDLFNTIGFLPRMESFTIWIMDYNLIETLAGSIGNWTIRNFALYCEFDVDNPTTDCSPLFDAVANSRHIKAFTTGFTRCDHLPRSIAAQLFALALSPTSGLLDIDLEYTFVIFRTLSTLVPHNVDPTDAARRQLRRFIFLRDHLQLVEDDDNDDFFANIPTFLRLLKQLPHLYSIGLTIDDWIYYQDCDVCTENPAFRTLLDQFLVQIEKNHVGMTLLEQTSPSTVPAGLCSLALYRAIAHGQDPKQIPWTGIYHMVRALVEGGYTGWSEGDKKWGRPKERQDDDNRLSCV